MKVGRVLPILFNTEMVRSILDGRKTVTRRIIKGDVLGILNSPYHKEHPEVPDKVLIKKLCKAPYQKGDILYVRETWCNANKEMEEPDYYYLADIFTCEDYERIEWKWRPSIHMPKAAARIWLRVTDVRVERLQDIMKDPPGPNNQVIKEGCQYVCDFIAVWENTIKISEKDLYGWDVNPWVWVIEFERFEKPEECGGKEKYGEINTA